MIEEAKNDDPPGDESAPDESGDPELGGGGESPAPEHTAVADELDDLIVTEEELAEDVALLEGEGAEPLEEHAEGELALPDGVGVFAGSPDGHRRSVGIVVSRYNGEITNRLLEGAIAALEAHGVLRENIDVMPVPGAFELPIGAMAFAKTRRYSCVVALGCVIRGETPHFDYVCGEAASGLQLSGLDTGTPVSFGLLTCETREQADARAGGERGNKGAEAAVAALEMADVFVQLRTSMQPGQ